MLRLRLALPLAILSLGAAPVGANVVTDWNTVWMDCIRATGGPPCPISRTGAMVHAAVYDAVNSIDGTHQPYLALIAASPNASREAAAAQAAHDVLVSLFPGRQAILDAALDVSLQTIPNGPAKQSGVQIGQEAARNVIDDRRNDGSEDATPYVIGTRPGEWRPTAPDFTSPPFSPNWGRVRSWTMIRADQFRPVLLGKSDMHDILTSPKYSKAFREVKELGARDSWKRTDYQTQTAYFWANDVDGTYKPPGHQNHIAQVLTRQRHLTLSETARLFALLNIALADAGIVAWDCKYDTGVDFWRPITGIREADLDDNPHTDANRSWLPLNAFTPPFPAYISGHATFAATAAAVFTHYFGTDRLTHTITTDEPLYTGGPRTYRSFLDEAKENAQSRIYLGVHWQFDADDGIEAGTRLGDYVAESILMPVAGDDLVARHAPSSVRIVNHPLEVRSSIEFVQPTAGPARITVIDIQGRRVATLLDGFQQAGPGSVTWDGRDAGGARVASGIYFVRVEAAGAVASGKVVVAQ